MSVTFTSGTLSEIYTHTVICNHLCACLACSADSIEANVENADVNVQNATHQLARAADYQVNYDVTGQADVIERDSKVGGAESREDD